MCVSGVCECVYVCVCVCVFFFFFLRGEGGGDRSAKQLLPAFKNHLYISR